MSIYVNTKVSSPDTVNITNDNLSKYFTVSVGSYTFIWDGSAFTTNNGGVNSSTASQTLTLKQNCTVSLTYSYSSEANFDKFNFTAGGTSIVSNGSGSPTQKNWSGALSSGQTLAFSYSKDGSVNSNDDECKVWNIVLSNLPVTESIKTVKGKALQFGVPNENKIVKVKKAYIGTSDGTPKLWYQME